ncbi:hypothetical protein CDAR_525741 [Caerostris darwini]|uniref:Uncharacterized protein n=1 Tax=Caerostris darwini TaxID=1538125 RepID=A0AAV4RP00_9ARAC|nr:hypothetical protein CDAR_525741 [Caerostris darwini]
MKQVNKLQRINAVSVTFTNLYMPVQKIQARMTQTLSFSMFFWGRALGRKGGSLRKNCFILEYRLAYGMGEENSFKPCSQTVDLEF